MLPKQRRCLECDYAWSRYLDFSTCPKCGTNVTEAVVRREKMRLRRVVVVAVIVGIVASLLAEVIGMFW